MIGIIAIITASVFVALAIGKLQDEIKKDEVIE